MKPILSICMMVKDEEANLARCLDSLQPLMQEISSELVIVDTGSTDQTVAIAKQYTDKIYYHLWNNNFSEMRNISIRYATGEWVFIIDADEELESVDGIIRHLRSGLDRKVGVLALQVKNITELNIESHVGALSPRIFRRNREFCYKGVVHNEPVYKGTVIDSGDALLHYGYLYTDKALMERKFQRTSTLLKKELEKDPKNIYYRYQLAITYSMHGDQKDSLRELEKTYFQSQHDYGLLKKHIYLYGGLLQAYVVNGQSGDESIRIGLQGIKLEPEYVDLYYFLGQLYELRGEYEEAYSYFHKHEELSKNFAQLKIRSNLSIIHYTLDRQIDDQYNMALMSYKSKNYERARLHIDQVLGMAVSNADLTHKIQRLVFEIDLNDRKYENCQVCYEEIVARKRQEDITKIEEEIEHHWQQLNYEGKKKFSECFQQVSGLYGFLNRVRLGDEKISCQEWLNIIENIGGEINQLPTYYAPIFVSMMETYPQEVWRVSPYFSEQTLVNYMTYMDEVDKTLFVRICRNFISVLPGNPTKPYQMARIEKNMAKYLLFSGVLDQQEYKGVFAIYIEKSKYYLEILYNAIVFEEELIYDLKNKEEIFIMYMVLAERFSRESSKKVQYLKKALAVYPEMSKGIEIILQSLSQQDTDTELAQLIEKLLDIVETHIESKQFDDALDIVMECEGIIGNNLRLLAKKSEIYQKKYEN
ncbi:glycosyltransferase [Pelosinus sp. sgz500959]|uniref:glycosyltransferase n=1 Tax=Pelosinus sp. sgz500959 TaxID=3242472 RepID=UPI003671FBDF